MTPDERFWFHRGRHEELARIIAAGRARFADAALSDSPEARALLTWLREIELEGEARRE